MSWVVDAGKMTCDRCRNRITQKGVVMLQKPYFQHYFKLAIVPYIFGIPNIAQTASLLFS